jgi:hypothetical protein
MNFWQQVFSPGGLAVAVVCTLLGGLLGHWLTRMAKRQDDRDDLIQDVAEKYRHLRETNKTDGADGLIKSGVCRLYNTDEVEQAIAIIKNFGQRDPLSTLRERLEGKDIHHFLTILQDHRLNPFQAADLEKAISLAKKRE